MDPRRAARRCTLVLGLGSLLGCSSSEVLVPHRIGLTAAEAPLAEQQLLDVAIGVFDPGVPEGEIAKEDLERLIEEGIHPHIRRTESVQMAVSLRDTLQQSGQWGSVWVTPRASTAGALNVAAEILESDGYVVRLNVQARDATGKVWIDKRYELQTAQAAYREERYRGVDPYQDLFNSIANDLAAARKRLSSAEIDALKTIATLRYAGELSPEAFAGYLAEGPGGSYAVKRLPARDDPMLERTERVRQRERLFFETLDAHYEQLAVRVEPAYWSWREAAREESLTIRELRRGARLRTGLGVAAMIGGLLYGGGGSAFAQNAVISVGSELLNMGADTARTKQLHSAALEELSGSLNDELAPIVIETQGIEHRLIGTADAQYAELRELLRQMFIAETGLPGDADPLLVGREEPAR